MGKQRTKEKEGLIRGHTIKLRGKAELRTQVSDSLADALVLIRLHPILSAWAINSWTAENMILWPKGAQHN